METESCLHFESMVKVMSLANEGATKEEVDYFFWRVENKEIAPWSFHY